MSTPRAGSDPDAAQSANPDAHSSTERYAKRFAGPAGSYLLDVQTQAILELMEPYAGASVLDVGGGHGQIARPLSARGWPVTVLASNHDALGQARKLGAAIDQATGDLSDPPFPADSFDVAVSVRMMSHVPDWARFVAGLCRVARKAVIVDFPVPGGSNALEPLFFWAKRGLEGDTRRYVTIGKAEATAAFAQHGYAVDAAIGQFVLPMAVHRALKWPGISRGVEGGLARIGLAGRIGTPVLMRAVRAGTGDGAG